MLSIQYPVVRSSYVETPSKSFLEKHKIVPIVEGVKELDAIAPVNHLTGDRQCVLDLLGLVLSPDKKDLLQKFVSDVQVQQAMTSLSDEDMISLTAERLSTGYPAEDALFAQNLAKIGSQAVSALRSMIQSAGAKSVVQQNIDFSNTESPSEG